MTVSFSADQIEKFCHSTGDTNGIHNFEYMAVRGKRQIVPGMLTLSLSIHESRMYSGLLKAFFGSPLCEGDQVNFDHSAYGLETTLLAETGGITLLRSRQGIDSSIKYALRGTPNFGTYRCFVYSIYPDQKKEFCEGTGLEYPGSLLYLIANSSQALFESIKDPITPTERKIRELTDQRILPVYTGTELFMDANYFRMDQFHDVEYRVGIQELDRGYAFSVVCKADGKNPFYGQHGLIMVDEEKIISKMAKDAPQLVH